MDNEFWCDFVAGWIGGCAGLLAGHPMDTIKVRQQVYGKMSAIQCCINTFKYEGVKGLYKGLGFPLLAAGTLNSIFFGVYGNTIRFMSDGSDKQPSYKDVYLAGCAGGVVQLIVACPVDLIKIKMQMQTGEGSKSWSIKTKDHYKGPTSCIVELFRTGGISSLYRGFFSMTIRDVPSFGLYMIIYEALIRNTSGSEREASPSSLIFCGGIAGAIAWFSIVPLDVVKSRIQADDPLNPQYKGIYDCLKKSYRNDGLSVFTRGLFMCTLRAFPTNGAIFLGFATSMNLLRAAQTNSLSN